MIPEGVTRFVTPEGVTTLPRPSALVFDLDGTLVDSREDIASAANAALAFLHLAPLAFEAVLPMIGDGATALVERALAASGGRPADLEIALGAFRAHYLAHPCARTKLLPGAARALALGLPAAVVTNKPRDVTELVLRALGIREAFAAVRGGGDHPLKPAPDGIVSALAELGVRAADAWMIGDGPQDVLAGRAAGCPTLAVPGIADRAHVLAARPDHVARDLDEVCDLVERLTSPPA